MWKIPSAKRRSFYPGFNPLSVTVVFSSPGSETLHTMSILWFLRALVSVINQGRGSEDMIWHLACVTCSCDHTWKQTTACLADNQAPDLPTEDRSNFKSIEIYLLYFLSYPRQDLDPLPNMVWFLLGRYDIQHQTNAIRIRWIMLNQRHIWNQFIRHVRMSYQVFSHQIVLIAQLLKRRGFSITTDTKKLVKCLLSVVSEFVSCM